MPSPPAAQLSSSSRPGEGCAAARETGRALEPLEGMRTSQDLLGPSPGPCVLTESHLMVSWQLLWLQCCFTQLHRPQCNIPTILPSVQSSVHNGVGGGSMCGVCGSGTDISLQADIYTNQRRFEGGSCCSSLPTLTCLWGTEDPHQFTPDKHPAFLPSIYAAAF